MIKLKKLNSGSNSYCKTIYSPNFCIIRSQNKNEKSFANDITHGLTRKNKFISSKYFYDEKGSYLFDQICNLSEYYLTRKEIEILSSIKSDLSKYLAGVTALVELGSGMAIKTKYLFDVLSVNQNKLEYFPIDISDVVRESSERLEGMFDNLKITGIVGQYENGLDLIEEIDDKKLIVFFGSSIGNFDQQDMISFLRKIRKTMKPGDLFLLGLDLVKDKKILENAYDDSEGITREFNLNILQRINSELGGNFDLAEFEHVAFYNTKEKRIEMHLRSKVKQQIVLNKINLSLNIEKDEMIRTEYSYKYAISQIKQLAENTGLDIAKVWSDKQNYFALVLFSISP